MTNDEAPMSKETPSPKPEGGAGAGRRIPWERGCPHPPSFLLGGGRPARPFGSMFGQPSGYFDVGRNLAYPGGLFSRLRLREYAGAWPEQASSGQRVGDARKSVRSSSDSGPLHLFRSTKP